MAAIIAAAEEAAAAIRTEAEELLARRRAEADREAASVLAEAQRRAEQQVADQVAQARELARTVVERATELLRRLEDADEVKRGVEGLVGQLEEVTGRIAGAAPSQPAKGKANGTRESRLEPVEEARLMALQMAMAGRTRAEVEADLRHGLRVEDPESVLDDVFGRGTPGSQRIPWSGLEP